MVVSFRLTTLFYRCQHTYQTACQPDLPGTHTEMPQCQPTRTGVSQSSCESSHLHGLESKAFAFYYDLHWAFAALSSLKVCFTTVILQPSSSINCSHTRYYCDGSAELPLLDIIVLRRSRRHDDRCVQKGRLPVFCRLVLRFCTAHWGGRVPGRVYKNAFLASIGSLSMHVLVLLHAAIPPRRLVSSPSP